MNTEIVDVHVYQVFLLCFPSSVSNTERLYQNRQMQMARPAAQPWRYKKRKPWWVYAYNHHRQHYFRHQRAAHAQHLYGMKTDSCQQQKRIDPGHQLCYWHVRYVPKSIISISTTQAIVLAWSPKQGCIALGDKNKGICLYFICDVNIFVEKSQLFRLSITRQKKKNPPSRWNTILQKRLS